MNRGLYTAATGMSATQRMLDVTANNLANVSTTGFKGDGLMFKDALEAQVNQNGRGLGEMSYGVVAAGEFTNFAMGVQNPSGNPLDIAINGDKGAFKVDLGNGNYGYTRDGSFRLNDQKLLVDRQGHPVLDGSNNTITLDGKDINVQGDGKIIVDGQEAATLGVFDGTFAKVGGNMFTSTDAKPMDSVSVASRTLEGSNVNAVGAMIQMITLSRTFDMAQKAVSQHDELTQRLIQSLSGQ